ncbi:MAG TPA: SDR family oxidoreductase [Longimicrobium sp.]|nr:SDR family oxidoreductase [Longimicrobium sp.]
MVPRTSRSHHRRIIRPSGRRARGLVSRGWGVFGTSRRAGEDARAEDGIEMLAMDVDSDASVECAVAAVLERAGRVDAVVNNAGWALAGAVEDTPADEARAQLETNFLGVWRVCRAVLPAMRAAGRGCIVNIGSIGGRVGLPFQAADSAGKFAVAGFTEALSGEVRPFGIHAVLIEPGNYRTGLTARRRLSSGAATPSPYARRFGRAMTVIEQDEARGADPEGVARVVARVLDTPSPRMRYLAGPVGERAAAAGKPFVPGRLFERIVLRLYGIE